jgi:hypothetical protein
MLLIARLVDPIAAANSRIACARQNTAGWVRPAAAARLAAPHAHARTHFAKPHESPRGCAGALRALHRGMAAVFLFVFLFGLASIGLLYSSFVGGSIAGMFALVCFVLLAAGVFVGTFKMTRKWEDEAGPQH